MTHREFLLWLRPRLETGTRKGLTAEEVRAIRRDLQAMLRAGPLQPFASRLLRLLEDVAVLDGATVAGLAVEVRAELAPPRERTVVASSLSEEEERPQERSR
ncbi:MAG: hypothetical protein ACRENE_34515 [Polyangiaceae bacterium]